MHGNIILCSYSSALKMVDSECWEVSVFTTYILMIVSLRCLNCHKTGKSHKINQSKHCVSMYVSLFFFHYIQFNFILFHFSPVGST